MQGVSSLDALGGNCPYFDVIANRETFDGSVELIQCVGRFRADLDHALGIGDADLAGYPVLTTDTGNHQRLLDHETQERPLAPGPRQDRCIQKNQEGNAKDTQQDPVPWSTPSGSMPIIRIVWLCRGHNLGVH